MSKSYISTGLRRLVYKRANGCCEYCFTPENITLVTHEIDHIIAEKHGGTTISNNLALSCTLCNKHKGSDLTSIDIETGNIVPLYHPRQDKWLDHFKLERAYIVPLTAKGRVTVQLLQLNRWDRIQERKLLIEANLFNLLT